MFELFGIGRLMKFSVIIEMSLISLVFLMRYWKKLSDTVILIFVVWPSLLVLMHVYVYMHIHINYVVFE